MEHPFSSRSSHFLMIVAFVTLILALSWTSLQAQEDKGRNTKGNDQSPTKQLLAQMQETEPPRELSLAAPMPCADGTAGNYPCQNVDLLGHLSHAAMGMGIGNDIWGWTDPLDGTEYALVGSTTGTSFIDLSDPFNPVYLGRLPSHNGISSTWRDMKVYANHAFIVADGNNGHGMQVFDLTELRTVVSPPVTFSNTAHYSGFGSAHNIVINEDSGYAYGVGADCSGGLHMVDIQNPLSPTFAGCFSADGYTHDAQCVIYNGPDATYQGNEICFNSNEDTLTIVDVTNKTTPVQLSRTGYSGSSYTHQSWLTEDHTYVLLGDELDELNSGHNTRTYIWDVSDLDSPSLIGNHTAASASIDHNMYVRGKYVLQSNYSSGLRILDISDVANGNLTEEAFFDTYPANDNVNFNGQWSNYPYFDSGIIIANDRQNGLFILWPTTIDFNYAVELSPDDEAMEWAGQMVTYTVWITNSGAVSDTFALTASNIWTTTLSTNSIVLLDGSSTSFEVTVEIPHDASNGDTDIVTITAVSQNSPVGINASTHLTTTAIAPAYSVSLTPDQAEEALPGTTVTYTVWLTNSGNVTDSFNISATGDWTTAVSPTHVILSAGSSTQVWLRAEVPVNVLYGIMDTAVLTATSTNDPAATASTNLTTTAAAVYAFDLQAATLAQSGEVGTSVTYTIWITNTGNASDTYDFEASGIWAADVSVNSIGLAPGVSASITVWVTIPAEAMDDEMDTTVVTAVSQNNPTTSVSTDLITTAEHIQVIIYLPFVTKP